MDAHLRSYFDSRGRRIPLGKKIGSGGEGNVFEIVSSSQRFVAKSIINRSDEQKQEKLRVMVRGCNDTLKEISAWPVDLIHNGAGGPVCGFVMPRVSDCEPVHKVYGPTHRKQSFPEADWKFLVRAAKNLAAAFDAIHFYGYVIGDVNEGNILVDKHACVTLIDCDSFQVKTSADVYCCEVGVAQFTPRRSSTAGLQHPAGSRSRYLRSCNPDLPAPLYRAGTPIPGCIPAKRICL